MSRYTSFTIELSGTLDAARALHAVPARILQAQRRALATVQRRLGPQARRDIGAEYNLLAGRIAAGLIVQRTADGIRLSGSARGVNALPFGATWSRVKRSGWVATSGRRPRTAIRWGGVLRGENRRGARYAIKRGDPRTAHEGSFIARAKQGVQLVFERKGRARLPLEGVYGPSVGQMLKHGRRPERLAEFALRTLETEQRRLLGTASAGTSRPSSPPFTPRNSPP